MESIAGSPYVELQFDKGGAVIGGSRQQIVTALAADGVEDLVVLSHGWKSEGTGPRLFYHALWPNAAAKLTRDPAKVVVVGVAWPSKRYTTGIDASSLRAVGASVTMAAEEEEEAEVDLDDAQLAAALANALDGMDDASALTDAVANYRAHPGRDTAESLLAAATLVASLDTDDTELAGTAGNLRALGDDIGTTLANFADPPELKPSTDAAQTLGLGETLRGFFSGPRSAIVRVLEQLSYFEM
jgi:hypothetical protein